MNSSAAACPNSGRRAIPAQKSNFMIVRSSLIGWLLITLAAAGCGSKSMAGSSRTAQAKTTTRPAQVKTPSRTSRARGRSRAPTYRVGQYCTARREAEYRSYRFTCAHHHIQKL